MMLDNELAVEPTEGLPAVVLLVDDEVLVRLFAAELLREEGYTVLEAGSAAEALDALATGAHIDVVLTDVRMPGAMDGMGLSFAIKEQRPLLPVVLVSTHLPVGAMHTADGFLEKPFRHYELFAAVMKHLPTA